MNKYQRKKAKCIKKLSNLGLSNSYKKQIMRNYNLNQINTMMKVIDTIKNLSILKKIGVKADGN